MRSALALLGKRQFFLLWGGQTVSALGDAMVITALTFAVLGMSDSPGSLGLVLTVMHVARTGSYLVGGVLGDRFSRRLVMIVSDSARMLTQAVAALLLITGQATLWWLVLLGAVYGGLAGLFRPSSAGLVAQVAEPGRLQEANALLGVSREVVTIAGPALAAVLVVTTGPGWVFAADAGTFAVGIAALSRMRLDELPIERGGGFWHDVSSGLREAFRHSWYRVSLSVQPLWNFANAVFTVLGPAIALHSLGGVLDWGLINTAGAAGAVVGGMLALKVVFRRPLVAASAGRLGLGVLLAAMAVPLSTGPVAAAALVSGLGWAVHDIAWMATVQRRIPGNAVSRAVSYEWTAGQLMTTAGFALAGPLSAAFGMSGVLLALAGLVTATSLLLPALPAVFSVKDG
ncbi:MFS transporter [Nonomuraea rosea]|uniref:MFS transporter n=1 Tax=Nonomuraea rosea TaxID=638574 RepID=A0ABP6Z8M0_9ACTN